LRQSLVQLVARISGSWTLPTLLAKSWRSDTP
jgi:hypothetical protein